MSATIGVSQLTELQQATLTELLEFMPEVLVQKMLSGMTPEDQGKIMGSFHLHCETKVDETAQHYKQRLEYAVTRIAGLEESLRNEEIRCRDAENSETRLREAETRLQEAEAPPNEAETTEFRSEEISSGCNRVKNGRPKRTQRVNLKLPTYRGDFNENPAPWVLQTRKKLDLMGVHDDVARITLASRRLEGPAAHWFHDYEKRDGPAPFETFEIFVEELTAYFSQPWNDHRVISKVVGAKQGELSILDFSVQMRSWLSHLSHPNALCAFRQWTSFAEGLNSELARRKIYQTSPKTFEEAVEIALPYDYGCVVHPTNGSSSDYRSMNFSSLQSRRRHATPLPVPSF
ncbi:hypothetical protein AeMF1_006250 [Aphanomyces euteiches]|nr:hypothetical protein AeMF1_019955 [Aphanomyces euteiches]KAH9111791.1 hypothetical protein AeMF1_013784 [Aphanomyces euteiches]KAH9118456.1 hypothetical protein AeMF1_008405 [Aphanomyces euteiches]KAH9121922.1 hypothetical protein AeMF1_006562 [Aphanomyces euteiches]KAH9122474.1 hypothetical protein AeMF1_006250 [Aphanomyces euteiches]